MKKIDKNKWIIVWDIFKDILEIASLIISAIVAFLTFQTLQEMRTERINTYMPNIVFGEATFLIQTGELDKDIMQNEKEYFNNIEAIFNNKMEFGGGNPSPSIKLSMTNIGAGMAKDIKISLTRDSSLNAINEFNEHSEWCKINIAKENYTGDSGDNLCYPQDDWIYFVHFDDIFEIPYMQSNGEYTFYYPLSDSYYSLIYAMVLEYEHREMSFYFPETNIIIPDIKISIEYSDIQGIHYLKNAYIHTEIYWLTYNAFGLKTTILY